MRDSVLASSLFQEAIEGFNPVMFLVGVLVMLVFGILVLRGTRK